ncbi:MAG: hypothetical protein MZV70_20195 [Desulfobacterales bacterium]|nr:hypothetical protein [Desulfobacterales bacterium]
MRASPTTRIVFVRNLHAACHPIDERPRPGFGRVRRRAVSPDPGRSRRVASRAIAASACSWPGGRERSR